MLYLPLDTIIAAERVALMPARKSDYEEWAALRSESRTWLEPWEPRWPRDALSRQDWSRRLRAWNSAWKAGTGYVFLIRRHSDNRLIGGASLTQVRAWPANSASLGYWMGEPYCGHGYMKEGVRALCGWAFNTLHLARIEAGIVPENDRSRSVLAGTGFAEEGRATAYLEIAGVRRDHILFGLVRPEFHR